MLPTTPSDLDLLLPCIAENARISLMESRKRSWQICEEATAVCATAAQLRKETAQLRHSAVLLRTAAAQFRVEGMLRRQKGLEW
jgi:hypothetical protein